jgi:lysine 6-dehydrogenase
MLAQCKAPEGRGEGTMRIAVLGAGRQGVACAIDLLRERDVEGVLLLDSREEELAQARERIQDARLSVSKIDASDEAEVAARISGCRAVVSAVPYFLNLGVTRAAIQAGCSMTDMGGNTDVVFRQRALDEKARAAGVTIVPDLGLAPGLGNILAAASIEGIDEPDSVKIRCGGLPLDPQPPLKYATFFSIHGLLNEYAGDSVCLRDGKIARVPTLTEPEWIWFPEPVGPCQAVHTSGGTSTLPWTLEGKVRRLDYKTVRYPGHWSRIAFLKDLGMLDTEPVTFGRASLPPREIAAALLERHLGAFDPRDVVVLRVRANGRSGRREIQRQFDLLEIGEPTPGLTAMMKLTAFPTAAVALELARGTVRGPGVIEAERAVDAARMIAHLRSRGITVTESVRTRSSEG